MYIKIIIPFIPISVFYFFCPYLIIDISAALVTLEGKGYMVSNEQSLEMIALKKCFFAINISLYHCANLKVF